MSANSATPDFSAWIDQMPGRNHAIHVKGRVQVPTGGWSGTLTEAIPPGINPTILILDAALVAPTGPATDALATIEISFTKDHGEVYKSVQIRGLGEDFTIPVGETH